MIAQGIRHPASGIRHPASGIRHPASGIRHPGICRIFLFSLIFGLLPLALSGCFTGRAAFEKAFADAHAPCAGSEWQPEFNSMHLLSSSRNHTEQQKNAFRAYVDLNRNCLQNGLNLQTQHSFPEYAQGTYYMLNALNEAAAAVLEDRASVDEFFAYMQDAVNQRDLFIQGEKNKRMALQRMQTQEALNNLNQTIQNIGNSYQTSPVPSIAPYYPKPTTPSSPSSTTTKCIRTSSISVICK